MRLEGAESPQETADELEGTYGRANAIEMVESQLRPWLEVLRLLRQDPHANLGFDISMALMKMKFKEPMRAILARKVEEHLALCGWRFEKPERGLEPSAMSRMRDD